MRKKMLFFFLFPYIILHSCFVPNPLVFFLSHILFLSVQGLMYLGLDLDHDRKI